MIRRAAIILFLPATFLFALPLFARVVMVSGVASYNPSAGRSGWGLAHAADWTLNGAPVQIEVWGVPAPPSVALNALRADVRREGGMAAFLPGSGMAWGAYSLDDRLVRCLVLETDNGRASLAFLFVQTEEAFRRGRSAPAGVALPDGVPLPPGTRLRFTAANQVSGTFFALAESARTPAETRQAMADALARAGWSPIAGTADGSAGPLAFYVRSGALCAFSVKLSGHDGACMVTLIHRRLGPGDAP